MCCNQRELSLDCLSFNRFMTQFKGGKYREKYYLCLPIHGIGAILLCFHSCVVMSLILYFLVLFHNRKILEAA